MKTPPQEATIKQSIPPPPQSEMSLVIDDPIHGTTKLILNADPIASLTLIALAALGVVAMALRAVLLALKNGKQD
jgi:hypothetical protein